MGQSLLCFSCYSALHCDHPTLSLHQFLRELDNSHYDQSAQQSLMSKLQVLKRVRADWLMAINKFKEGFERAVGELEGDVGMLL